MYFCEYQASAEDRLIIAVNVGRLYEIVIVRTMWKSLC